MTTDTFIDLPDPWTLDLTEAWLTEYGLPVEFRWTRTDKNFDGSMTSTPGAVVLPQYQIKKGYGFWLRTTPYFPGLFELVHQILDRWPEADAMPSAEAMAELLKKHAEKNSPTP